MKLVVLGATGRTGQEVVTQALAAGHQVTAVVRDPHKLPVTHDHLQVVAGDATNLNVLKNACKGHDAIIMTIGPAAKKPDYTLMQTAIAAIIAAAKATGVRKVVVMSSFIVRRKQLHVVVQRFTGLFMKKLIRDRQLGEQILMDSDLDWTIVHATRLVDKPHAAAWRVVPGGEVLSIGSHIARADAADFLLRVAESDKYRQKMVTITAKKNA